MRKFIQFSFFTFIFTIWGQTLWSQTAEVEAAAVASTEEISEKVIEKSHEHLPMKESVIWKEIDVEDIIAILSVFLIAPLCAALIVTIVFAYRTRQKKIIHETMNKMVEQGMEIPPDFFLEKKVPEERKSHLNKGIIYIAVGLAIAIALYIGAPEDAPEAWPWALIPLFIGIAHLLIWKVNKNDPDKKGNFSQSDTDVT